MTAGAVDGVAEPLPRGLAPMLATPGPLPTERDGEWAFEVKWDGVRALAEIAGPDLILRSRTGREQTGQFPELIGLAAAVAARDAVLDGEVIAPDAGGRPSFASLQQRLGVTGDAARRRMAEHAVRYLAFDILHVDGRSTRDLPYARRRALLVELLSDGPAWSVPGHRVGGGAALLAATVASGLEGVVAKRLASPYRVGRRSPDWVKVRNERTDVLAIGGWTAGEGSRAGELGALLLGVPAADDPAAPLAFAGRVGTGFGTAERARLLARLHTAETPRSPFAAVERPAPGPPRGARFVTAGALFCAVAFTEWTRAGTLRHPTYRGLAPAPPIRTPDPDPKDDL